VWRRVLGAAALLILPAADAGAGEIVTREDVAGCRSAPVSEEEYRLDTEAGRKTGEAYRAGSSIRVCGLCDVPVRIFGGTSFTAVDVDLLLRGVKGKVRFSGNMLPLISRVEEECRQRRQERERREP